MASRFDACLPLLLASEGGAVDDPKDPGGRTDHGVTQAVYDAWRAHHGLPRGDVFLISEGETRAIYQVQFWVPIMGEWLGAGVDYVVFDFAVNSGVHRAAVDLQKLVGADDDGHIGQLTLAAVRATPAPSLIDHYCDLRLAFLEGLPGWAHDGRGWAARVARVRADARRMAGAS